MMLPHHCRNAFICLHKRPGFLKLGNICKMELSSQRAAAVTAEPRDSPTLEYRNYLSGMQWYLTNGWTVYYLDALWNNAYSDRIRPFNVMPAKANVKIGPVASGRKVGQPPTAKRGFLYTSAIGSKDGFLPSGLFVDRTASPTPTPAKFMQFFVDQILPHLHDKSVIALGNQSHHELVERPPLSTASLADMTAWLRDRGIPFEQYQTQQQLYHNAIRPIRFRAEYRKFELDELARERGVRILRLPSLQQHYCLNLKLNPFVSIRNALKRPFGQRAVDWSAVDLSQSSGVEELVRLAARDWPMACERVEQAVLDNCDKLGIATSDGPEPDTQSAKRQYTIAPPNDDVERKEFARLKKDEAATEERRRLRERIFSHCLPEFSAEPLQHQVTAEADAPTTEPSAPAPEEPVEVVERDSPAAKVLRRLQKLVELSSRKDALLLETHHLLVEQKRRDDERLSKLASLVREMRGNNV